METITIWIAIMYGSAHMAGIPNNMYFANETDCKAFKKATPMWVSADCVPATIIKNIQLEGSK